MPSAPPIQKTSPTSLRSKDVGRLGPLLGFHPAVETRFEQETAQQRIHDLRQAVYVGLVFFNLYSLTAFILTPDVVWLATALRLLVITPIALGIAWALSRVSATTRERMALLGSIGAASVPVTLLCASHAPQAAYTTGDLTLSMLYSTMMLVLRFPHALVFVAVVVAMAVPSYYLKANQTSDVSHALVLQLVCAGCYLLFGNYRVQRSLRTSYLQATQAVLRSADLETDKTALERLTLVDPLTGISNRRGLFERLASWRADPQRHARPMAVIMADVDHFKRYNDEHGHTAGDLCLTHIARAMAGCLRDDRDLLSRYGGEEFAVLLPGADAAEAGVVAQRLCDAVAALGLPHSSRGDGMSVVTMSAGVASATAINRPQVRALFDAADAALYEAKTRGRNQLVVAAPMEAPATPMVSDMAPLGPDGW